MINDEVRHIIEPELEAGEELLWAARPQGLVYCFLSVFILVIIATWISFAIYDHKSINIWGPWIIVAALVALNGFYPNFDRYAITDKQVMIKRFWLTMRSAKINRKDIYFVSLQNWFLGDCVIISKKSKFPALFPFFAGSNASMTLGLWEKHWFFLFVGDETERVQRLLS